MPHFYEHINILVMPTDACNMDCVYCFHTTHQSGIDFMSIETVKQILDITTPFYKRVNLIWHGGEPLLLGLDFYKEVVRLQKLASCYTSCMGRWIGIRYNGEIGPCNRYFPAEYSYGNVYDYSSIGDAFESAGFMNLLSKAIIRREKCKACEIYHFCNGGCNNTAMNENGIENNEGLSCRILVSLYKHINDFINNALSSKSQNNSINPLLKKMLNDSIKEKA